MEEIINKLKAIKVSSDIKLNNYEAAKILQWFRVIDLMAEDIFNLKQGYTRIRFNNKDIIEDVKQHYLNQLKSNNNEINQYFESEEEVWMKN